MQTPFLTNFQKCWGRVAMVGKAVAGTGMFSVDPPEQSWGRVSSRDQAPELQASQGGGSAPSPHSRVSGYDFWEREKQL